MLSFFQMFLYHLLNIISFPIMYSSGTSITFSHRNQSVSFGLSRSGLLFLLFSQCFWSLFPEHRQGTWLPLCGSGKERRARQMTRLCFPPSRREMLLWMSTDGCSPERSRLLKLTIATSSLRLLVEVEVLPVTEQTLLL